MYDQDSRYTILNPNRWPKNRPRKRGLRITLSTHSFLQTCTHLKSLNTTAAIHSSHHRHSPSHSLIAYFSSITPMPVIILTLEASRGSNPPSVLFCRLPSSSNTARHMYTTEEAPERNLEVAQFEGVLKYTRLDFCDNCTNSYTRLL